MKSESSRNSNKFIIFSLAFHSFFAMQLIIAFFHSAAPGTTFFIFTKKKERKRKTFLCTANERNLNEMNGKILLHNGIEKSEVEQDGNFSTIFCSLPILMETFQLTFVVGAHEVERRKK